MSDVILDDMRRRLSQIELTMNDGDRSITFKSTEDMNKFVEFRKELEKIYNDLVLNGSE